MATEKMRRLKKIVSDPRLREAHRMLRVVSGMSRYFILRLLKAHNGSLNVTEIAEALNVSCSLVSHEMRILKRHKLVVPVTEGREVFYRMSGLASKVLPR